MHRTSGENELVCASFPLALNRVIFEVKHNAILYGDVVGVNTRVSEWRAAYRLKRASTNKRGDSYTLIQLHIGKDVHFIILVL